MGTHGTGCTFSSALLAQLVAGSPPAEAVGGAKRYVRAAMEAAYPVGKGRGPLNHLYRLDEP
jgi:hydroxymethylpyrimidine/phosphomethylpyrimidine kinase